MIVAILCVYLVLLFVLVRLHVIRFNLFWKVSPFIVLVLLNLGLFIPMGWGAPQGPALVVRNSVAIVPSVAGEVIDVPVEGNKPLKAGDTLFRIDPVPYHAQVAAIEAQLKLSDLRLAQMTQLYERDSGRAFDVQQRQSEVDQLKAQLEGAKWNLDKTVVQAPADGYVTNLDLTLPNDGFGAASKAVANLCVYKLRELSGKIEKSLKTSSRVDAYSLAHLSEAKVRIDKALDAQYIYNVNSLGGGGMPMMFFGQPDATKAPKN